jgi:hypothetical protein
VGTLRHLTMASVLLLTAGCLPTEVTSEPDEDRPATAEQSPADDEEAADDADDPTTEDEPPADEDEVEEATEARVGDSITLEGRDTSVRVQVVEVIDPVEPTLISPEAGNRLVGIELEIENVGEGVFEGYPSNGATLVDADNRQYAGTPGTTPSCQEFDGRVASWDTHGTHEEWEPP